MRAQVFDIDWRAPLDALATADLAILGTPWDYTDAKEEFLARLVELEESGVIVCNGSAVVRWNADKLYLRELAARGAPSIPTLWPENPTSADIQAAFDHFDTDRIVVKRRVGAGAIGQDIFQRDDPAITSWQMNQAAMIQPFLPAIEQEGELSFIFVEGSLSHTLIKRAASGDYRIQSLYGGIEAPLNPAPADRDAAEAIMAMLPFSEPPLYARIDMIRLGDGRLAVIEAELIEPYLYPLQGPQFGRLWADAIMARMG